MFCLGRAPCLDFQLSTEEPIAAPFMQARVVLFSSAFSDFKLTRHILKISVEFSSVSSQFISIKKAFISKEIPADFLLIMHHHLDICVTLSSTLPFLKKPLSETN